MKFWRVDFDSSGKITGVVEIAALPGGDVVVVRADDKDQAFQKAHAAYNAHKKKLAKMRHFSKGECACGRKQDRQHPSGRNMKTCSVCAARASKHKKATYDRAKRGIPQPPRDEAARVVLNLQRQRDRRGEIRLETLVEVRKRLQESFNYRVFEAWLKQEIQQLLDTKPAAS